MLMFAKLLLMSFIYKVLKTFCFPDENIRSIFKKYSVEKVEMYHVLTDINSTPPNFYLFPTQAVKHQKVNTGK